MSTFITGGPGSGTTFMAALYKRLGYDLGDLEPISNDRNQEGERRGMEDERLINLFLRWHVAFFPRQMDHRPRHAINFKGVLAIDDERAAELVRPNVAQFELPDVVKSPHWMRWLNLWLKADGERPDLVVVMMRDTLDQALSNVRDNFTPQVNPIAGRIELLTDYGFLFETLASYNIPFRLAYFPLCAQDARYCATALRMSPDELFMRAHSDVARPDGIKTRDEQRRFRSDVTFDERDWKPEDANAQMLGYDRANGQGRMLTLRR